MRMEKKPEKGLLGISNIIEFLIASLIITVVVVLFIDLIFYVIELILQQNAHNSLIDFLEKALNLVIGIEFVKMLCNHKPGTVIEVLLFAIARQMIVEHLALSQTVIGVISIGLLFGIRKFLFTENDV